MKKNFLLLIGLLTLMSLSGCTNINSSSKKEITVKESVNEEKQAESILGSLTEIVGKSDEYVVKKLGEGKEENGIVFSREYNIDVLKGNALVTIGYNENKVVDSVNILPNDTDYDGNIELLNKAFGKYSERNDDSKESEVEDRKYCIWKLDDCTLTLMHAYGSLSVEIRKNI